MWRGSVGFLSGAPLFYRHSRERGGYFPTDSERPQIENSSVVALNPWETILAVGQLAFYLEPRFSTGIHAREAGIFPRIQSGRRLKTPPWSP